jgi:hypothetical protein
VLVCQPAVRPDRGERGEAVKRLFRRWGGEAIYVGHEPECDKEIGTVLRSIGEPSIVVAALPMYEMHLFGTVGERFTTLFRNATAFAPEGTRAWRRT